MVKRKRKTKAQGAKEGDSPEKTMFWGWRGDKTWGQGAPTRRMIGDWRAREGGAKGFVIENGKWKLWRVFIGKGKNLHMGRVALTRALFKMRGKSKRLILITHGRRGAFNVVIRWGCDNWLQAWRSPRGVWWRGAWLDRKWKGQLACQYNSWQRYTKFVKIFELLLTSIVVLLEKCQELGKVEDKDKIHLDNLIRLCGEWRNIEDE